MPSATVEAINMTSQTEDGVMSAPSQTQRETQPKPPKTKASYTNKFAAAYPRVVLLLACIFYLASSIVAVQFGLVNISNLLYHRYDRAEDELRAQSTTLYKEEILYARLDKLLSSQLSRGFMETHEDCLVGGLGKADYELLGLGFQYPDIRVQVMDWTMENCGKLQYTPQVLVHDPTPQQAVLTGWADAGYRSRQMLEEALEFMRQQVNWIWSCFMSASPASNASMLTKLVPAVANVGVPRSDQRPFRDVPFGFSLRCEPSRPCRLSYSATSGVSDKVNISPEALAELAFQSEVLRVLYASTYGIIATGLYVLIALFSICIPLMAFVVAMPNKVTTRATQAPHKWNKRERYMLNFFGIYEVPRKWNEEERYLWGYASVCSAQMLVFRFFMPYPGVVLHEGMVLSGHVTLLLGVTMLLQFFIIPGSRLENVAHVYGLIKELYPIARGWEVPDEENIDPDTSFRIGTQADEPEPKATEDAPPDADTDTDSDSSDSYQSRNRPSSSHHHMASAITQAMDSNMEPDVDTESETESEAEHGSFVDLAGGVTPQLTDVGSGWSMVDA